MSISDIRARIDEIDTALIALISLRMEQSKKMKDLKGAKNIEDEKRENEIRRKWRHQSQVLGLNEEFCSTFLELIFIESKRIQSAS